MPESQAPPRLVSAAQRPSAAKRIGLAAVTGFGAKGLGLATQVIAVAIAVRALGQSGFALYVVIASLVSWIGLAGLGVAPGLTLGVARASARGDRTEEARLFVVALFSMTAIAALLVGGAVLLGTSGVIDRVVSGWLGLDAEDASAAFILMALLISAQLVVVVPEAAQLGLQAQHVTNLWASLGSAAAILAMLAGGGAVTSVSAFILISQGPQVAARAVNGVLFALARRQVLCTPKLRFWQHARSILGSGIAFAGISLASYLALQVGLLVMAATTDPTSVALAGVIVRGYTLEVSGLSLLSTPTWPAIANARSRGDVSWIRRTYRFLVAGGLLYSAVAAAVVLFGLEALIGAWTGSRPPENAPLRTLLAVFVLVNGWGHVNAMTLVGLGVLRFTAIVLLGEAVLVLLLVAALAPMTGLTGYAAALAVGALAASGWMLPLRVRRELTS
jgi:O-antigen/teichoic acid export membrane protein